MEKVEEGKGQNKKSLCDILFSVKKLSGLIDS